MGSIAQAGVLCLMRVGLLRGVHIWEVVALQVTCSVIVKNGDVHHQDTQKDFLKSAHQCGKLLEKDRKAVQYTIVHRDPQAFQQPVTPDLLRAMCERAFGQGTLIELV
jgi:hypothetical protein